MGIDQDAVVLKQLVGIVEYERRRMRPAQTQYVNTAAVVQHLRRVVDHREVLGRQRLFDIPDLLISQLLNQVP